ncbi:MAG TPA: nuclear transport factor 2 family protein [Ideonella sp.]|uniref:YybH family protein n=1 Tax=Ideonella sp. TaxID=1929293 RepID=UPI002C75D3F3|nr:nuclear transport factor 2 family protein [Ideonella sp.]HSI51668.1 nuclear transport factor 2 family protein [Ideonella sp.]
MTSSTSPEKTAIEATIFAYFEALNHGDVNAAMGLYTDDPVQLPFMQPTVVGTEAVRKGYQDLFGLVCFQMRTKIAETVQMSPQWAFVRTESAGSLTPVKTGQASPATFHEVFLLRKTSDAEWRIARYSFSPTAALPEL